MQCVPACRPPPGFIRNGPLGGLTTAFIVWDAILMCWHSIRIRILYLPQGEDQVWGLTEDQGPSGPLAKWPHECLQRYPLRIWSPVATNPSGSLLSCPWLLLPGSDPGLPLLCLHTEVPLCCLCPAESCKHQHGRCCWDSSKAFPPWESM